MFPTDRARRRRALRSGHTEARRSVQVSGRSRSAVISEVMNDDGTVMKARSGTVRGQPHKLSTSPSPT